MVFRFAMYIHLEFKLYHWTQVYDYLEHRLAVAEAAQRLRLPLLSKDGEINEEEIEKVSMISRSSIDSTISVTPSTSSNSTSYNNSYSNSSSSVLGFPTPANSSDAIEPGVGGVPNRFLGVTADFLWQVQQQNPSRNVDTSEHQRTLVREIECRLDAKCEALADIFTMNDNDSPSLSQISSARLPERVKLIIEEIEREEAVLLEDLYSMDRKFAEHYNVLEQILGVLIRFVKDLKLQHQHQYVSLPERIILENCNLFNCASNMEDDELRKTWLCKRCQTMNAKLSVLEHLLLRDTYTKDSVPALHKIRKYLLEATEEASIAYNKAVTRLREYQGVDPHFDTIARQYHEIVKKLEGMQWTIHQVEMDLKRSLEHSS
ncbi:hypothetical protein ZIOFF_011948 [Zingiber officinale]|uniref:HAUS augmin-like complex subunit 4 n=1 Tax=Zingiber officinale TaxID=94328 RepID=A0A8J5HK34_ZINOF|nr:hypothetical protein ZIOFF_011948 [Zingiber officinale]